MDHFGASASEHQKFYKCGSPSWKESYRRRCCDRLKNSRAKLLERFRTKCNIGDGSEYENIIVDDILKDELGQQENYDADFDSILKVMEEIRQELIVQEREILLQHDRLKEFEDKEVDSAILDHEHHTSENVLCPICSCHYLQQFANIIGCKCGVNINVGEDSITLDYVGIQLRVGTTVHADKCQSKPIFGVVHEYGNHNMVMSCETCDFMFIVL